MKICNMEQRCWRGNREPDKTCSGRDRSCQPAWSPLPRPYKAASPSVPHSQQPATGLAILGTACRNPHLREHRLTGRVISQQVDWQAVESSTPSTRGVCREEPALKGVSSQPSGTRCGWAAREDMYNCAGCGQN